MAKDSAETDKKKGARVKRKNENLPVKIMKKEKGNQLVVSNRDLFVGMKSPFSKMPDRSYESHQKNMLIKLAAKLATAAVVFIILYFLASNTSSLRSLTLYINAILAIAAIIVVYTSVRNYIDGIKPAKDEHATKVKSDLETAKHVAKAWVHIKAAEAEAEHVDMDLKERQKELELTDSEIDINRAISVKIQDPSTTLDEVTSLRKTSRESNRSQTKKRRPSRIILDEDEEESSEEQVES